MKFEVKKEELINLTHDSKVLPLELTKEIAGGGHPDQVSGVVGIFTGAPDESCAKVLLP